MLTFNKKEKTYSTNKELIVRFNKKINSENKKTLEKLCKIESITEENSRIKYCFSNIVDYNHFLYILSNEIVKDFINSYFKNELKKYFPSNYKKIMKNHEDYSFESNYFEFLTKVKLLYYFKNNNELNVNSFIKFNIPKLKEELDSIIEIEIEADGGFLEESEHEVEEKEIDKELSKRYNSMFMFLNGKSSEKEIFDIHIFSDSKSIKIINEKGILLNSHETDVDFIEVKEYFLKNVREKGTDVDVLSYYLALVVALHNPERIITYNSLDEDFKNTLYADLAVLKQVIGITTECYRSEANKPS